MSQFAFLQREWPDVYEAAAQAEAARARRPAHGVLLRPPRAGARGRLGLQARRRAAAPVPGQPQRADPRADLQAGGRRGGVQQGAASSTRSATAPSTATAPMPAVRCARGGRASCSTSATGSRTPTRAARSRAGTAPSMPTRCRRPAPVPKQTVEQLQQLEAALRERDEKLVGAAGRQDGARRGAEAAARRGRRGEEGRQPRSRTRTTTPRPRPATTSSTSC